MSGLTLTTEAELAERFGLEVDKLVELRRRYRWPHVKLGRFDVRFTAEQIEQIVAQHSQTAGSAPAQAQVRVAGQTPRSARRRRPA